MDWCLKRKARPGFEEDFEALSNLPDGEKPDEEAWNRVSVSPYETLGVPRIGIDEAATKYFLEEIVPSHRTEVAQRRERGQPDDGYTAFWSKPDAELVASETGRWVPALVDYKLSTVTGMIAGAFDFRGKVVSHSDLLPDDLRNEAYEDMDPPQMAEYAGQIEEAAVVTVNAKLKEMGRCFQLKKEVAEDWSAEVVAEMKARAEAEGYTDDGWGYCKGGGLFEATPYEDLGWGMQRVLQAGRWLRFWADLGHAVWAWS